MTSDQTVYVAQGEYQTTDQDHVLLSTVLGSCVAACIWDPEAKLGGMNHFLLANSSEPDTSKSDVANSLRYGVHAMEMLINDLLKKGARRFALRAKLFGGANMASNLGEIGASNARFAKQFLATEDIPCLAESLGGTNARRVMFRPTLGLVRQMIVQSGDFVERSAPVREPAPKHQPILF
jgi:chemotaxis protein CheD